MSVMTKCGSTLSRLTIVGLSTVFLTACLEIGGDKTEAGTQASAIGAPMAAPIVELTATPAAAFVGQSTTLEWASNHAESCAASGDWSGDKETTGSETIAGLATDSTFTLTCSGAGGNTSRSATVTVTLAPEPAVTFTVQPTTVVYGQKSSLQWDSSNADTCTASGAWSGGKGKQGSTESEPLTANSTYTLTCQGPGGKKTKSVDVSVGAAPSATPTLELSASPTAIDYQGSSTVSWTTSNVSGCTASGGWSGSKSTSGSQSFSSLTSDRTYTLSCTGDGGSVTQSVTVAVAPPPAPALSLSADSTSVAYNGTSVLSWSSSDASSCSASGGWSGTRGTSGAETVGPLTSNTGYTMTCTGSGGSVTRTVALSVQAPPAPGITLSANSTSVAAGDSATLTWSTSNADSCSASGAWSGSKATSGNQAVGPINSDSTFTLSCTGPGGSNSSSRTVTVAPLPSVTLSANPTSVVSGGSTTLSWSVANATSCSASGAWSGSKGLSGSQTVDSLTSDSTFTLVCTGTGGSTSRSMTVTIEASSSRSVEVSWNPPSTRADGSPLNNLAGFKVHYGTASGSYTQSITVDSPDITSYQIADLTNGSYYFAVTAYDADNMESDYSMEVTATLN